MTTVFADLIGNAGVADLLERELAVPNQAYLFVGPESVGKDSFAVRFAAGLLCDRSGHHDDACRTCRLALARTHPDLIVVEPEGATSIGVEQARSMVTRASMAPVEADRTVFLIPDAGAMTEQAANSLLKTLEEPLAPVTFLLVAESEDDFPATIASRCRTIHMGRVPSDQLIAALTDKGIEPEQAESVAVVAGGRPGLALSLMSRPEVAEFRSMWLAIPEKVTPHPGDGQRLASVVIEAIKPLVEKSIAKELPKDAQQRARRRIEQSLLISGLEILASWYADSAALQLGGPVRNRDLDLTALTDVTPRRAVLAADKALDAVVDIQANLRRELVLANLFTRLGSDD
ncbi:DNA polymerase III subunit delta' [soil metagenome]